MTEFKSFLRLSGKIKDERTFYYIVRETEETSNFVPVNEVKESDEFCKKLVLRQITTNKKRVYLSLLRHGQPIVEIEGVTDNKEYNSKMKQMKEYAEMDLLHCTSD